MSPPHHDGEHRGNARRDDHDPRGPKHGGRLRHRTVLRVPDEETMRSVDRSRTREHRTDRQEEEWNGKLSEPGERDAHERGARGEHARGPEPARGVGWDHDERRPEVWGVMKAPGDVLRARGE